MGQNPARLRAPHAYLRTTCRLPATYGIFQETNCAFEHKNSQTWGMNDVDAAWPWREKYRGKYHSEYCFKEFVSLEQCHRRRKSGRTP
jgi:hypothetical protein